MFPKRNRLLKKEIEDLFINGARAHSPHFTLVYKKIDKKNKNSFSVVVSKKISPQAVARNKLKRRVRAIVKKTIVQKIGSLEGIIIAKPKAQTLKQDALKNEIQKLLTK